MLKLSKKFALPLIAVLIIGTGVGAYFLFRNFEIPEYFVDRYPELLEYCDVEESEDSLKVSCKALILEILPNAESPSLVSLIITKDEELKEYTITEKEEVFGFTNDILQFKKLKPIVINIQYTKINPIKYGVSSITFEDIPETYIQEIVNRDIEEIMGMDKNSTTILNSFDFCPRPETLPDYVIKKEEYAKYWEENILPEEEYLNGYNYNLDDTTIRLLFACDSANNIGYDTCQVNIEGITYSKLLSLEYELISRINENEKKLLIKNLSLLYDSKYQQNNLIKISPDTLEANICNLRGEKSTHCLPDNPPSAEQSMLIRDYNFVGDYLRTFFSNHEDLIKIYLRCANLSISLKFLH